MKRFPWIVTLLYGLSLLACSPAQLLEITRPPVDETAITATSPATWTPLPTITATATSPTTWTPLPTVTVIVTPTTTTTLPIQEDAATSTPGPTWTPLPSPTAVTTLLTPIQQLTAGQTLPINNDLLFINDGELQLWQPQTGQVTTLLAQTNANLAISGWQVAPDKQTLLIAQTPTGDTPGFILSLFDAHTHQLQELWSETNHYLFAYALAVDGRTVAFITSTTSTQTDRGLETVQLLDSEQSQVTKLADCPNTHLSGEETNGVDYTLRCQHLVAVPDGRTWLWRDIEGVWQGGLEQSPRLLVPHDYFEVDPARFYSPTNNWSPDGRYQLLSARRFEGGNRWLLDMNNYQTIEVPNSFTGLLEVAYWQWTPDNRLYTVRPPNYKDGEEDNFAELWHIEGNELVQDISLPLPNPHGIPAAAPSQLGDGRFAFILNHTDPADAASRNLYLITSFDQPPQPLVSLPPLLGFWDYTHSQSLTWTPDASGVLYILVTPEANQPFYIPADGSTLYDLTNLLGDNITNLLWLP